MKSSQSSCRVRGRELPESITIPPLTLANLTPGASPVPAYWIIPTGITVDAARSRTFSFRPGRTLRRVRFGSRGDAGWTEAGALDLVRVPATGGPRQLEARTGVWDRRTRRSHR